MFLDDLIGIKDVQQGDTLLPRRATLSFGDGISAIDDRLRDRIVVTFDRSQSANAVVTYQGDIPDGEWFVTWWVEVSDLAGADIVRLQSYWTEDLVSLKLTGMDSAELTRFRKVLVNVGTVALEIVDNFVSDDSRFFVPNGTFWLEPNAAIEVLWMPAHIDPVWGESFGGWRIIGGAP